jgi:hypothetical protein
MPKPPPVPPQPDSDEPLQVEDGYEISPDLEGEPAGPDDGGPPEEPPDGASSPRGRLPAFRIAVAVAAAAVIAGGILWYRGLQHRRQVELRMAKAVDLLRLDTAAGYRDAADLLTPVVEYDPLEAGSARAFALAMLFADYRDAGAEGQAEALLATPERAGKVPTWASLARAALSIGRREAGNATNAASQASDTAWGQVLLARTAMLAGNARAGVDPAGAAAAGDPRLAAALAIQGDLARRVKKDHAAARAAYDAALAASPVHPRAAYGLAKLALAGRIGTVDAIPALQRVLSDRDGTPGPERGRAALHLAALSLRVGGRTAAVAALDAAALDPQARAWAERAAQAEANLTGTYRGFEGAPSAIASASDDDPTEPLPEVAPSPPPRASHATSSKKASKKVAKVPPRSTKKKAGAKKTAKKRGPA